MSRKEDSLRERAQVRAQHGHPTASIDAATMWLSKIADSSLSRLSRSPWQVLEPSPGLALQRATTREPDLEQTGTALRALASALELELA
jgi:hypothetical protein